MIFPHDQIGNEEKEKPGEQASCLFKHRLEACAPGGWLGRGTGWKACATKAFRVYQSFLN
jgi:hypothetical protein